MKTRSAFLIRFLCIISFSIPVTASNLYNPSGEKTLTENLITAQFNKNKKSITSHPRLLLKTESKNGFHSVEELRKTLVNGHSRLLWEKVKTTADEAVSSGPLTAFTPMEGRSEEDIKQGNREYGITHNAGQRVMACALVHLLTGEKKYREAALKQAGVLFDTLAWPEWQDIYHRRVYNFDADLRTGMLCRDLGLAYDWLNPSLTPSERKWFINGLDRCGIQPYLRSVARKAWWLDRMNNWTTVIVGGLGICGMALAGDHPQSDELINLAVPRMKQYMEHYGAEGEFNENPGYGWSTANPVLFFISLRYFLNKEELSPEIGSLLKHCIWHLYNTIPPGVTVPIGDAGPDYIFDSGFFSAVASATRNPVLQWFYLEYADRVKDPVRALLYYDASLEPQPPTPDEFPLGRAFPAYDGILTSRTGWNQKEEACVVVGKAGYGGVNHSHPDAGEVIITGYGRRLINDPGVVSYPAESKKYFYHFNTSGHNVLTFNGREMLWDNSHRARIIETSFDNHRGASWSVDLTELHEGAKSVRRSVLHLLPGVIAVLDEARFSEPGMIRVRWHPETAVEPDGNGQFLINNNGVSLSGCIVSGLNNKLNFSTGNHHYDPPYNRDRMGNLLPQRNEPYLDAWTESDSCRILSLFSVYGPDQKPRKWMATDNGWLIDTPGGPVKVYLEDNRLRARYTSDR